MVDYFEIAANMAKPQTNNDRRAFWLGAVYIRADGKIVKARNGESFSTKYESFSSHPAYHAEGRVLRKADHEGILYVARISRNNGDLALAKPCPKCSTLIEKYKVRYVYYTIDPFNFGIWNVCKDIHIIKSF